MLSHIASLVIAIPVALASDWSYHGATGPREWTNLGNELCGGSNQSPVALSTTFSVVDDSLSGVVFTDYSSISFATSYLENNGHSVELVIPEEDVGTALMSGGPLATDYQLHQLHFHWGAHDNIGSEHTVDGRRFPLEMHLVHYNASLDYDTSTFTGKDDLSLASFLFEISEDDNENMSGIVNRIESIVVAESETEAGFTDFSLSALISDASNGGYFHYYGSLTTPTCDEVVNWIIFTKKIFISSAQMTKFREAKDSNGDILQNNFRPIQKLNGRTVTAADITSGH